jgi:hypothetical protein
LHALARAKFDVGPSALTAAQQLMRVEALVDLPQVIRPIRLRELKEFFVSLARTIVRKAPAR